MAVTRNIPPATDANAITAMRFDLDPSLVFVGNGASSTLGEGCGGNKGGGRLKKKGGGGERGCGKAGDGVGEENGDPDGPKDGHGAATLTSVLAEGGDSNVTLL